MPAKSSLVTDKTRLEDPKFCLMFSSVSNVKTKAIFFLGVNRYFTGELSPLNYFSRIKEAGYPLDQNPLKQSNLAIYSKFQDLLVEAYSFTKQIKWKICINISGFSVTK